jgi:hypothetical protein
VPARDTAAAAAVHAARRLLAGWRALCAHRAEGRAAERAVLGQVSWRFHIFCGRLDWDLPTRCVFWS